VTVRFLAPARDEFAAAVSWYNKRKQGLAARFSTAVKTTVRRICTDPESYESPGDSCRRCRVIDFPYAVVYSVEPDEILIVAVMHLHRRPGYWQDRSR